MYNIVNISIILNKLYKFWFNYISPTNFSYWWNFGSMALIMLILQIISGIFLAMHYKSDINYAFASVIYILNDVNNGWLLKFLHSNGASMFFVAVYVHILRGIMFGSYLYPRQLLWMTGIIIFILMIATAFFGYVLPWGQMSFWAATVITSLFSAIPLIGNDLVLWLWGGFSVDDATLNRFFSLHFFLPFVILGLSILHIMLLHEFGSNNPYGLFFKSDILPISPYYVIKDLLGIMLIVIILNFFVFFIPNYMGHSDNFIIGNPLVTPNHIVPEWYFLPFYAILRSIPDKLCGVFVFVVALLLLLFMPFFFEKNFIFRSLYFRPLIKFIVILFTINFFILGWIGGKPVIQPYYFIGQISTSMYFIIFLLLFFTGYFEQLIIKYYLIKC